MNLLIVGNTFPNPGQVFIHNKILGLAKAGLTVTNLSYGQVDQRALKETNRQHGIRIRSLTTRSVALGLTAFIVQTFRFPARTWSLVQAWRSRYPLSQAFGRIRNDLVLLHLAGSADVVHFEWNSHAAGHVSVLSHLGCPFVVSIRGRGITSQPRVDEQLHNDLKVVFAKAAFVHSISQDLVAYLADYPHNADRVRIIHPALDLSLVIPASPKTWPEVRLVTVAHYRWKKNLPSAIQAVARLIREGLDVRYDLIGEGPEREHLQFIIDEQGLSDRIRLRGKQPHRAVLEQLAVSDVFIMPSIQEGFCNAVVEAQAAGLPCVVTDADGLAENVIDGVTGIVVPRFDGEVLYARLRELVGDEPKRKTLGAEGRVRATERFDIRDQLKQFIALYTDAISKYGKA